MSGEINEFPSIEGNNLNKEKKVVPDDFVDKDLIIIVAFQQWHQGLVDQSINLLENQPMNTSKAPKVPRVVGRSNVQEWETFFFARCYTFTCTYFDIRPPKRPHDVK